MCVEEPKLLSKTPPSPVCAGVSVMSAGWLLLLDETANMFIREEPQQGCYTLTCISHKLYVGADMPNVTALGNGACREVIILIKVVTSGL